MLDLELQTPAGEPLAGFDFGDVLPGTSSAPLAFRAANTGDTPHTRLLAWVEQASTADGEMRVSLGGVAVTGTAEAPTVLPGLAPGATVPGEIVWLNPAGSLGLPVDSGTLHVRAE